MTMMGHTFFLDRRSRPWVLSTNGEVGILASCMAGSHDEGNRRAYSLGLSFAHRVTQAFLLETSNNQQRGAELSIERASQYLVEIAEDCLREEPTDSGDSAGFVCTAWFAQRGQQVFLSCGTTRVVCVDETGLSELIRPHSVAPEGAKSSDFQHITTHLLGVNCASTDIRDAAVRRDSETAVALIADSRLAEALEATGPCAADLRENLRACLDSYDGPLLRTYGVFEFFGGPK